MPGVVYEIKNKINGKRYIGLTRFSASKRWKEHVRMSGLQPKSILHKAIVKYGSDSFSVTEIASSLSLDFLGELESILIRQECPEYNQTCGGEVTRGRKYDDETKERIRLKNIGQKRSKEVCEKISSVKRAQYAGGGEKMREASRRRFKELRHIWEEKRIAAVKAANAGRKMPEAQKEMLRNISKTRVRTPEEIAKIAKSKTKKVLCVEDGSVFLSRHEAAAAYGVSVNTVWRSCHGKGGPRSSQKFKYYKENK